MRERISESLKNALKKQERRRVATLRLVNAAITDRDIALRGKGKDRAGDDEILDILAKMVKQREESSKLYREAGRDELEAQENEEIEIIREFLPKPLSEAEVREAIRSAVAETGATSLRDMGKVMGLIKERYRGRIDMGKAGALIKAELGG
ncbi:MAG: GatB/YqeY domain-containing protein [Pseudomonadota bacterium]|nr:GatB/YqeY domain-containing protein [Pseudomonadota bacterium]